MRRAMTLIELLVVVSIMVVLIGLGVPLMRSGVEGARLREGARQINVQIQLAKAHAAETGRECGVWFHAETVTGGGSAVARTVYLAESPGTYSGDIMGAACEVRPSLSGSGWVATFDGNSASLDALCDPNDTIKFNYKGPRYRIASIASGPAGYGAGIVWVVTLDAQGEVAPVQTTAAFQVFRRPAKSSSLPLEMPANVVIDLGQSGYDLSDFQFGLSAPVACSVILTFDPAGQLSRVLFDDPAISPQRPVGAVSLLVGTIEQATGALAAGNENVRNNGNYWVTVTTQGRVSTNQNAWSDATPTLANARQLTIQ